MSTTTINLLKDISPENLTDDVKRVLRCIGNIVIEEINDADPDDDATYVFEEETTGLLILGDDSWGAVIGARVVDGHLLLTANYGDEGEYEYCLTGHSGVNAITAKEICIPTSLSDIPVDGKQVTITLSDEAVEAIPKLCMDTLTTAIEGGINYWAEGRNFICKGKDGDYHSCELRPNNDEGEAFAEGDKRNDWQKIGLAEIEAAMMKIASGNLCGKHIRDDVVADLLDPDACRADAETADVIIQVALFGEVVFG